MRIQFSSVSFITVLLLSSPALSSTPAATSSGHVLGAPKAKAKPTRSLVDQLTGESKASYERGKALAQSNNWEGAELQFRAAYESSKDPRVLMALATSQKNIGRYAEAHVSLERMIGDVSGVVSNSDRAEATEFLTVLKPFVGRLRVDVVEVTEDKKETVVAGATVTLDGVPMGTTPIFTPALVSVGRKAKIHVEKAGYTAEDAELAIVNNSDVVQKVVLTTASARLDVRGPSGSSIWIDDALVGTGSWAGRVSAGSHKVRVSEDGRKPYVAVVDIKDGATRTVEVSKLEGTGWPWWVWVGGGAIVAGGAAVGGYCLIQGCVSSEPQKTGDPWLGTAYPSK